MDKIEQLKAELALLEKSDAKESETVEGTVFDGEGGLYMTIRDEHFEIRQVSVNYPMMKFAQARRKSETHIPKHLPEDDPRRKAAEEKRNEAGLEMMALLLDAIQILLKPRERERFDAFMTELSMSDEGLKNGELEAAIGQAMATVGEAMDKGKAGDSSSSASSNSSPSTSENVRVISSNKATAEQPPADLASKRDANFSTQSH